MRIRNISFFMIAAALLTSHAWGQSSFGVAKYAGEFMATGVGGRALAMGGAFVAVANDVTTAYWNPAGLMHLQYPEIGLMYENRFGGLVNYNYGGVAWPFGSKYTVALTVTRLGVDDIPDTRKAFVLADVNGNGVLDPNERPDPKYITMFNSAVWAAYLSYAFRSTEDLSFGVNMKLLRWSLAEGSATGIGFDIGAHYAVTPRFTVGANIQDVTTTLMAWNTGTNELISPTAKLGGAYAIDFLGGTVTPALDFDVMAENRKTASTAHLGPVSFNPRGGLEFAYKNLFAFRAGYSDVQTFSFGAGVHFPKLFLDYAFGQNPMGTDAAFKDPTHRISLRIMLEEKKFLRPVE